MRTVESKILSTVKTLENAVKYRTVKLSKRDSVESASDGQKPSVYVYLWNTWIAKVQDDEITLRTGGYRTVTTKSRLNALLQLSKRNYRIYQKDYEWFLYNCETGETSVFSEGMTIAR